MGTSEVPGGVIIVGGGLAAPVLGVVPGIEGGGEVEGVELGGAEGGEHGGRDVPHLLEVDHLKELLADGGRAGEGDAGDVLVRDEGRAELAAAEVAGAGARVRGTAGVMFTLDTESGFRDVVFITGAYGLGETVVQGAVNPDEFYVHKPALKNGKSVVSANKALLAEKNSDLIKMYPTMFEAAGEAAKEANAAEGK